MKVNSKVNYMGKEMDDITRRAVLRGLLKGGTAMVALTGLGAGAGALKNVFADQRPDLSDVDISPKAKQIISDIVEEQRQRDNIEKYASSGAGGGLVAACSAVYFEIINAEEDAKNTPSGP